MSRAKYTADQLRPFLQQNTRGVSQGDIWSLPSGELVMVGELRGNGTAELEPLGVQRRELDKAVEQFRKFAGVEADRVMKFPAKALQGPAWKLGDLCGVLYEALIEEDGKVSKQLFFHPFKKSARPTFAVLNNGRTLATLGGGFQVTERGIVDD